MNKYPTNNGGEITSNPQLANQQPAPEPTGESPNTPPLPPVSPRKNTKVQYKINWAPTNTSPPQKAWKWKFNYSPHCSDASPFVSSSSSLYLLSPAQGKMMTLQLTDSSTQFSSAQHQLGVLHHQSLYGLQQNAEQSPIGPLFIKLLDQDPRTDENTHQIPSCKRKRLTKNHMGK